MKRRVKPWTVSALHKRRDTIFFPEYQRQSHLWSPEKKALLIDSILRDIDIPKLYFNCIKDGYEVIDGQQRLWAIWGFLDGDFRLGSGVGGRRFVDLTPKQKETIEDYEIQITEFDDADEDYLRQLFLRLQLGLLLNTGEKLHAQTGAMKDWIFDGLSKMRFVRSIGIQARRFAHETLCAQIAINFFAQAKTKTFSRTRYEDLEQFFKEYAAPKGDEAAIFKAQKAAVEKTFDGLWSCFGARSKSLRSRSLVLSLCLFFHDFAVAKSAGDAEKTSFSQFTFKLIERLREEVRKGINRTNEELYTFETILSSAPGERYQIERRHEKLAEYFLYFKKTGKIKGD